MSDRQLVRYQGLVHDSARWDGFVFRPDDIVISTPPKCGTTWTQMICALHPRDVALSMNNHWDNMDMDAFVAARLEAVGADDVDQHLGARPVRAATPRTRFWDWVDDDTPPKDSGSSLLRTLRHLETFWSMRNAGNVVMLHYSDLKADLEGQMRALAVRLAIAVPEDRWPTLVEAATFDAMRRNADKTVPNASKGFWRDPNEFFHRGTSGQWRDLLGPDDLVRYDKRVATLVAPDLAAWAHLGAAAI
jgi:aryl sulfotransferase